MKEYYIDDKKFIESELYKNFMKENNSLGFLEIRANSLEEALPIENLNIKVSTEYLNNKIVFFDGMTDSSGMIKKLDLPTPKITTLDKEIPNKRIYIIEVYYDKNKYKNSYLVNIYDGICVEQNVNIIPLMDMEGTQKWQ